MTAAIAYEPDKDPLFDQARSQAARWSRADGLPVQCAQWHWEGSRKATHAGLINFALDIPLCASHARSVRRRGFLTIRLSDGHISA